jgi:hypothetical protein
MKKQQLEQNQHNEEGQDADTLNIPLGDEEALGPTLPEHHHHISNDIRHKVDVHKWLADNRKDPALKVRTVSFILVKETEKLMGQIRTFFLSSKITFSAA